MSELEITVYTHGPEGTLVETEFDADYISFVNHETYGRPAILAPGPDHVEGATDVLYVNLNSIVAVQASQT